MSTRCAAPAHSESVGACVCVCVCVYVCVRVVVTAYLQGKDLEKREELLLNIQSQVQGRPPAHMNIVTKSRSLRLLGADKAETSKAIQ
ncbi:Ovostatin-like 1 [Manis pentadactyla]|nr:Ovostatin-like 1 [Manis pentadactyla]